MKRHVVECYQMKACYPMLLNKCVELELGVLSNEGVEPEVGMLPNKNVEPEVDMLLNATQ